MDLEFVGLGKRGRSTAGPYKLPAGESQSEIVSEDVRGLPITREEVDDGDENNRADRGSCETVEGASAEDA